MLTAALLLLAGGYAVVVAALAWVASRAAPPPSPDTADAPSIVVVVAARNEEHHLPRCLDALLAQDYPEDRLQIIVADDHSTDGTADVVRRVAARLAPAFALAGADDEPPPRLHCVAVPDPEGPLRGKANALHAAIAASDADLVLVTDADCAPPPTWAAATAARFADPEVGLVCGFSRITPRADRPFDHVQAADWAFLLGAMSALAEAGAPATGMGNNMAVRRTAYDAVGGYPALPFSVAEDFTLVRAVATRTRFRVRFPLDPATTVATLPMDGLAATYRQRRRWARGGLVGDAWVLAAYAAVHLVHLSLAAGLVLLPGPAFGLLVAKMGAEGALLRVACRRSGTRFRWRHLPGFEAFLFLYTLTLPSALLLRPGIRWKGRTL
jgi:cellulose synthase/poly-beta-1,6-N-acetylglucosamine synthase-like glycosyltransferase